MAKRYGSWLSKRRVALERSSCQARRPSLPLQWQRSQPEAAGCGSPAPRTSDLHAEDVGHRHRGGRPTGGASCSASLIWVVSVFDRRTVLQPGTWQLFARPQKSWTCLNGEAHAVKRAPCRSGLAGTVRARPDAANLKAASNWAIEKSEENARRPALPVSADDASGLAVAYSARVALVWVCLNLLPAPDSCRVLQRACGRVKDRAGARPV